MGCFFMFFSSCVNLKLPIVCLDRAAQDVHKLFVMVRSGAWREVMSKSQTKVGGWSEVVEFFITEMATLDWESSQSFVLAVLF